MDYHYIFNFYVKCYFTKAFEYYFGQKGQTIKLFDTF